ncbi:hypothetical protein [Algoriphagus marinus]|uniref:hypothetical protein n=1 Tax=Algoriphagus marinus TaxID=1925762 RepID=UPI00094BB4B9|nr:hypothetical protein [Algoriphagus marinus]
MGSILEEIENYSFQLHRDDLYAKTDEEFIKINKRNQLEVERIKKNLEKLEVEKVGLVESWNSMVILLKENDQIKRVTDRTKGAHTYSFKMEILLPNKLGIGFCLSQIGKLIGIYFTSGHAKSIIPITEYTSTIGVFSKESKNPFISYFPYSEEQINFANKLISCCERFFPEFQLFNNIFAATKIEDIVIDGKSVYRSDLFQVLFADNLVII